MRNHPENGVALVSVLGILSLVFLLAATIVAVSQTMRLRSATGGRLGDSVYHCESAVNTAVWLVMNDRRTYPERGLSGSGDSPTGAERYRADGREYVLTLNGVDCSVRIADMYSGVNLAGRNATTAFKFLDEALALEPERRRDMDVFRDRLLDYLDADDNLHLHGMEKYDYAEMGLEPLPRNASMQYREEVLWIPGGGKFINPDADGVLRYVSVIPPRGVTAASPRPSLFGAPLAYVREKAQLNETETLETAAALTRLRKEGLSLEEAFLHNQALLVKLQGEFSITESGFYSITARCAGVSRTLNVSLRIEGTPPVNPPTYRCFQWQLL